MKSRKIIASILAIIMLLSLAACGSDAATSKDPVVADTPAPVEPDPVVEDTPDPIAAGTYFFAYVDIYGDTSRISVRLNDDGSFDIMTVGAIGIASVSGIDWADNGDGSFTTGALLEIPEVDIFGEDGSVTWKLIDDENNVVPVDYVEPTEFEERPVAEEEKLPENMYAWKETAMLPTDWIFEIVGDGTYKLSETNDVVGSQEYGGKIISQDGNIVVCGPLEGNRPPVDNWCNGEDGFTVELGDGIFEPVGAEDSGPDMGGMGPDGGLPELDGGLPELDGDLPPLDGNLPELDGDLPPIGG